MVWAFPRGKPQLFTATPRALSEGVAVYAFGRRIPRIVQTGIAVQIRVPGIRRLVAERHPQIEPICGWDIWDAMLNGFPTAGEQPLVSGYTCTHNGTNRGRGAGDLFLRSVREWRPEFFLTIESIDNRPRGSLSRVPSFRVPACIDASRSQTGPCVSTSWCHHSIGRSTGIPRAFDKLPPMRRGRWPAHSRDVLRSRRIPSPMHGDWCDLVFCEDERGQLWLLDWEDAGWGRDLPISCGLSLPMIRSTGGVRPPLLRGCDRY